MLIYLGVFSLSASTLAFEIVFSRLFSIAQFYHFAFMTVSLVGLAAGCLLALGALAGFTVVLIVGAACYGLAMAVISRAF